MEWCWEWHKVVAAERQTEETGLEDHKFVVGCAQIFLQRDALHVFLVSFLPEADTSSLPAKRSLAERQGRSAQCGTAPKREIGAEANGSIYVKVVLQVHSERSCQQAAAQAPHQAGGLPRRAGPSTGGRPSPAACPRSVSNTLAGCKRKGLEEEEPTAAQLPTNKRVKGQSGDSVPAPAAHPGPAAARSSKQRARRRRQKERRVELKKAALRAAAARAEASAVNSLVEMMQKLQLKD
eukprot:XP_025002102.1 zinc finger CCCH domain-containing protein 11A-like [Gallus gallus]